MGSKPRSLESILNPGSSKEEVELFNRFQRLELLKRTAEQFSDHYFVGTTSAGKFALYFPDEHVEKQNPQSHESILDNSDQQSPTTNPEPKVSIKEYFIAKQNEQKEEEAKWKALMEAEASKTEAQRLEENLKKIESQKLNEDLKKRVQKEMVELEKRKARELELSRVNSIESKSKLQNFRISIVDKELIAQEFEYLSAPPGSQEAEVLIQVTNEMNFGSYSGTLMMKEFANM